MKGLRPPVLVAVTGRRDSAARTRSEALGFELHVVKPVDLTEVLSGVEALVRGEAYPAVRAAMGGLSLHSPCSKSSSQLAGV